MSAALALAFLVLLEQPDPLSTARRLMLEGDLSTAIPVLESVVDGDSPDRSRAGLLLEVTRQLLEMYSPDALVLLTEEAEDRLTPSDTMTVDGELMLLSGRLDQLNSASESPFPMIYESTDDLLTILLSVQEETPFSGGTLSTELLIGPPTVSPGDTVRIWIPLALAGPDQDPESPSWEVTGILNLESSVSLGDDGELPVLYVHGVVSSEAGVHIVMEQSFSIIATSAPAPDIETVVLPVPGSSVEVDRNLAVTEWIDPSSQAFIAARDAAGAQPNPVLKVDLVMNHLLDEFRLCQVPVGPFLIEGLSLSAGRRGYGDSAGISALFSALCRALGVPARVAAGLVDTPSGPAYHCFTELMFEPGQWVPVDLVLAGLELWLADSRRPSVSDPQTWSLPMVRTCRSIEDPLSPSKYSWRVTLPGGLPEAEVRHSGGRWYAVPLSALVEGTVTRIEQR